MKINYKELNSKIAQAFGLPEKLDRETSERLKKTHKIFQKINRRQAIINKKYEHVNCGFKDEKCGKHPVCIVCVGRSFFKTKDGICTMEDILLSRYKDWSETEIKIIKTLGN
jgi:hypothetical protein